MKKYYLIAKHDEDSWSIETDESTFYKVLDDINLEYEIQKDFEIDGTERYFQFDGSKYELIGFIEKQDEIDEVEARLNYWFSYPYDPSHL